MLFMIFLDSFYLHEQYKWTMRRQLKRHTELLLRSSTKQRQNVNRKNSHIEKCFDIRKNKIKKVMWKHVHTFLCDQEPIVYKKENILLEDDQQVSALTLRCLPLRTWTIIHTEAAETCWSQFLKYFHEPNSSVNGQSDLMPCSHDFLWRVGDPSAPTAALRWRGI